MKLESIGQVIASNLQDDMGKGWFLQALFLWRLWGLIILPLSSSSRLTAALAVAIAGGYDSGWSCFHAARAASMFPIYVLGQLFPLEEALHFAGTWSLHKALLGALLLLVFLCLEASEIGEALADVLPEYEWEGLVLWHTPLRATFFWLFSFARNLLELSKGFVLLLLCCPRNESVFAVMGRRSLYPYLLHGPFVWMNVWLLSPVSSSFVSTSLVMQALAWSAALALATISVMLLSCAQVERVFGPLLEPAWPSRLLHSLHLAIYK